MRRGDGALSRKTPFQALLAELGKELLSWAEGSVVMGGYGSGRSGGRPTVESGLTLDLQHLFKTGWLKANARTSGLLKWTLVSTGEETASIGFESDFGDYGGYVQLRWTSTNQRSDETRQCENRITLMTFRGPTLVLHLPAHGQERHEAASALGGVHLRVSKRLSAWIPVSARIAA